MKKRSDIERQLLPETSSLRDAMERLNSGIGGVVLFVNDIGVMTGLATDGDIRRAVLSGCSMEAKAHKFMQRDFTFGNIRDDRTKSLGKMSDAVRHLPLVDDNKRPVDILSWTDFWQIPLVQPSLAGNETRYVSDCLSSGWVSSQGGYIAKFENAVTSFLGGGTALCTSSGTTALHLALLGLEIGPGDEVIVPNLTFGATANAVVHAGATPVFVDINPETWTIGSEQISQALSDRTKAVIPVHLYGHPCDIDPILKVCDEAGLKIIEDCAEAFGAEYKNKKVGTFSDVACFSFFANKVITTGEGGMVWSQDKNTIARMSMFRDHGMSKERRYWHNVTGYNYRMTNMQAAIGLAQMEQIDRFLSHRRALANQYHARLSNVSGIKLPSYKEWAKPVCWLYTIEIDTDHLGIDIDALSGRLREHGVETRRVFIPLSGQPAFNSYPSLNTPVAEQVAARGLSLPTSNEMNISDVNIVCDALCSILETLEALTDR
ncbi:MAG: aminotransferase class I/II-fold pyridoxal phosphate-dependent enzyme [Rhodospirillaceae bacterium]